MSRVYVRTDKVINTVALLLTLLLKQKNHFKELSYPINYFPSLSSEAIIVSEEDSLQVCQPRSFPKGY